MCVKSSHSLGQEIEVAVVSPVGSVPSSFSMGKAALFAGSVLVGGAAAFTAIKSADSRGSWNWRTLGAVGIGGTSALAGWKIGQRAFNAGNMGMARAGSIGLGLGLGALVGGIAGAAFIDRPAKPPKYVPPTPTPTPTPGPGPTPGPIQINAGEVLGAVNSSSVLKTGTSTVDRSIIASAIVDSSSSVQKAEDVFSKLTANAYVRGSLSGTDLALLTATAVEAGGTGEWAAAIFQNIEAAQDTGGGYITDDLELKDVVSLARGAMIARQTGEHSANTYGNIAADNFVYQNTTPSQRASVAAAALETNYSGAEAIDLFNKIAQRVEVEDPAEVGSVVAPLVVGAMRGQVPADDAASLYKGVARDTDVSGNLTAPQIARLAGAAIEHRLTADDAALTFVNIAADDVAYNDADDWEQILRMSVGSLQGLRTGAETAAIYRALSQGAGTSALDKDARFTLAAAAASVEGLSADKVIQAYGAVGGKLPQGVGKNSREHMLLTAAAVGGFDSDTTSDQLDWMRR